jgi:hypothetical protein
MNKPTKNSEQLPVAWMETYCGEPNNLAWSKKDFETIHPYDVVPLYKHPVAEQPSLSELTDQEISEEAKKWGLTGLFSERQFARAIIKASRGEK